MRESTIYILFLILRSVCYGNQISNVDKLLVTDSCLQEVVKIALKHDIAHLIALGTLNNGLVSEKIKPQSHQYIFQAIYRYEKQHYELQQVCEAFEKARIPFIPLKGAVIRQYYPEPWMRTSCDIDILIRETDLYFAVSILKKELNYHSDDVKNYHDISLYSSSGIHLELHYNIKEGLERFDGVLSEVWNYAFLKKDKQYQYEMTNEFLVFHIVAHMAYHFLNGGCGIRSLMDLSLLKSKIDIDANKMLTLLEKANLVSFYKNVVLMSDIWFGEQKHNEITSQMQDYILDGGVYGSSTNRIVLQQQQKRGKLKYILYKVFFPYNELKNAYPIIEKYKWLTPVMEVHRWFKFLSPQGIRQSISELKINANVEPNKADAIERLLNQLEL